MPHEIAFLFWLWFLASWFMSIVYASWAGSDRGHILAGFFAGLLWGPIGVIIACILPKVEECSPRPVAPRPDC